MKTAIPSTSLSQAAPAAGEQNAIEVQGLWKRYGLPLPQTLYNSRAWLAGLARGEAARQEERQGGPFALRDLNFEVRRGETLGVIGHNGAGKSTLLKVLAGVTPPTHGRVAVNGRVFPMIELNAGMHVELTGRENIYLLGAIMGFSRSEVTHLMPEIESFCELGEWLDRPVRKYSSGMIARLGFAVAVNVDADILLVDEVLSVGDIGFQRKCLDRMEKIHHSGKTIVFVSHSIRQVERLCERTLLLSRGQPVAYGDSLEVISQYYKDTNLQILQQVVNGEQVRVLQSHYEHAAVEVLQVRCLDESGREAPNFQTGRPMVIEVSYRAHQPVDHAVIGIGISTVDSMFVSGWTNEASGLVMPLRGEGKFRCILRSLPLLNGIYTIKVKLKGTNESVLGGGEGLAIFSVEVPGELRLAVDYGLVMIDTAWENG